MFNAAGTVYLHIVKGLQNGQRVHMTSAWGFFGMDPTGPNEMRDTAGINAALAAHYRSYILPLQLNVFSVSAFETVAVGSYESDGITLTINEGEQGILGGLPTDVGGITPTSDPMPTFAAVGLRKISIKPGRGYRGSARLCCLEEANCAGDDIDTAKTALVKTGIDLYWGPFNYVEGVNTDVMSPAVFSRSEALKDIGGSPNPLQEACSQVLGGLVNPFVSSQVSRKKSNPAA